MKTSRFTFILLTILFFSCDRVREKGASNLDENGKYSQEKALANYSDTLAFGSSFIFINPYFAGSESLGDINVIEKEVVGYRETFKSSLPTDRFNVVIGKQPVVKFPNGQTFDLRASGKRVAVGIKEMGVIQGFDSWRNSNEILAFAQGSVMSAEVKLKPDTIQYQAKKDFNLKEK